MFAAFHKQSLRVTMLFILLSETKSLLNTKKILRTAILDHVWHQNYFFLLFSRPHDQTSGVMQDSVRWLKDQIFVCDVKFRMKMFDLD